MLQTLNARQGKDVFAVDSPMGFAAAFYQQRQAGRDLLANARPMGDSGFPVASPLLNQPPFMDGPSRNAWSAQDQSVRSTASHTGLQMDVSTDGISTTGGALTEFNDAMVFRQAFTEKLESPYMRQNAQSTGFPDVMAPPPPQLPPHPSARMANQAALTLLAPPPGEKEDDLSTQQQPAPSSEAEDGVTATTPADDEDDDDDDEEDDNDDDDDDAATMPSPTAADYMAANAIAEAIARLPPASPPTTPFAEEPVEKEPVSAAPRRTRSSRPRTSAQSRRARLDAEAVAKRSTRKRKKMSASGGKRKYKKKSLAVPLTAVLAGDTIDLKDLSESERKERRRLLNQRRRDSLKNFWTQAKDLLRLPKKTNVLSTAAAVEAILRDYAKEQFGGDSSSDEESIEDGSSGQENELESKSYRRGQRRGDLVAVR